MTPTDLSTPTDNAGLIAKALSSLEDMEKYAATPMGLWDRHYNAVQALAAAFQAATAPGKGKTETGWLMERDGAWYAAAQRIDPVAFAEHSAASEYGGFWKGRRDAALRTANKVLSSETPLDREGVARIIAPEAFEPVDPATAVNPRVSRKAVALAAADRLLAALALPQAVAPVSDDDLDQRREELKNAFVAGCIDLLKLTHSGMPQDDLDKAGYDYAAGILAAPAA